MKKLGLLEMTALFVAVAITTFFFMEWFLILNHTRNEMRAEASIQRMLKVAGVSYEEPSDSHVSDRLRVLVPIINRNIDKIEGLEGCVFYIDAAGKLQYYCRPHTGDAERDLVITTMISRTAPRTAQ